MNASLYNESLLHNNREYFILNHRTMDDNIRKEILDSWERCKKCGVNPKMSVLPALNTAGMDIKKITAAWSLRKELNREYIIKFNKILENTESVLFIADLDLNVAIQRGNKQLLDKLNSINLGIGASLEEHIIGSNAAAMAKLTRRSYCVIGAEHYIDALQDYACAATPGTDIKGNVDSYFMLITRVGNFHPHQQNLLSFYIKLLSSTILHRRPQKLLNCTAHYTFNDLIGSNSYFKYIKKIAADTASSSSNVLITGDTGTGKELFAQAIHNAGNRKYGPFISINCAAIPRELIGSELFGYVEGAFTGTCKGGATGKFELAHKGTIFLDEIAEMPMNMQSVLLRVLEEKQITRLGGKNPISVDVKIIAATNKDLKALIAAGEFRSDLYYRLNVIRIDLIPLRDRKDDIPLLVDAFLKEFNFTLNKKINVVSPEVWEVFQKYDWPGNVRELKNAVERAVNLCNDGVICINNLPMELLEDCPAEAGNYAGNYKEDLYGNKFIRNYITGKRNEIKMIMELMEKHRGNKTRVAKDLGITRATLYRKLDAMDLHYSPKG